MGVSELIDRLRSAAAIDDVAHVLDAAATELGFAYHALVHHGDLARPPDRFLFLQNYPPGWVDTYARLGLHRHDPAQRLANLRPGSFAWHDLPRLTSLSPREQGVLEAGHAAGLGEGFTVPLHAYGARAASCSFATRRGAGLPPDALPGAEAVARAAFSVLFDLLYWPLRRSAIAFPPRERESVVLAAQGKTDWEIAVILGLGEETVSDHLKSARRRFGVTKRAQLVAAALAHGLLGWNEVVSWQHPL